MARLNIRQKWMADPRRKQLAKRLGSERLADGMLIEVGFMMLEHKAKSIPLSEFKFVENFQDWIDCGLGAIKGEAVAIEGAEHYQEFFDKQKQNGSKGGRPPKPKITQNNPGKPNETQNNPGNPSLSFSPSPSLEKVEVEGAPTASFLESQNEIGEAVRFVPREVQSSWIELYDLEWLKGNLKKAVLRAKTANPKGPQHWGVYLFDWVEREKNKVFRAVEREKSQQLDISPEQAHATIQKWRAHFASLQIKGMT